MKAIIVSNSDKMPASAEYVHGDLYIINEDDDTVDGLEVEIEDDL